MRFAFVLETIEQCLDFIDVCSLTWCGRNVCLVPYSSAIGISDPWWKVLTSYDPDRIGTCVDLDNATQDRLRSLRRESRHVRQDYQIPRLEGPLLPRAGTVPGVSLYTVFSRGSASTQRDRLRQLSAPEAQLVHADSPYIRARYGSLNEFAGASLAAQAGLAQDVRLDALVPLSRPQFPGGDALQFILNDDYAFGRTDSPLPLIDATLHGVTRFGQSRPLFQALDPTDREFAQNIIIVSRSPNLDDLCWFWNLRSQRLPESRLLPLWADYDQLIHSADRLGPWLQSLRGCFLISSSLDLLELQTLRDRLTANAQIVSGSLESFYTTQVFADVSLPTEVHFSEGHARVPTPAVDFLQPCPINEIFFADVEVEDTLIPALDVLFWGRTLPFSQQNYTPTRTGFSYQMPGADEGGFLRLDVPSSWQILETYADEAGFGVAVPTRGAQPPLFRT